MCPPVGGSREGPYPGRHMGRPLQSRLQCPASPEERAGTEPRPYRATRGAKQRADVPKAWLLPTKFRSEIWGVSHGHRPLRGEGKAQSTALASGAQRSVCGADASDGRRGRQRSPPKVFSNLGQSLSRGKTATAPFAQGSLALRGNGRTSPGHRSAQQPQAPKLPALVPRLNVLRNCAQRSARARLSKNSRKLRKGFQRKGRSPSFGRFKGGWGVFFSFEKNTSPAAAGPRPLAAQSASRAAKADGLPRHPRRGV